MTVAQVDPMALRFGIEAEYALLDATGALADFRTLSRADAQRIVDRLGPAAHPALVRGDQGIKVGRWYIEGDERFDLRGRLVDCVPKGIETRTPPVPGIAAAVHLLARQTRRLDAAAAVDGLRLATIGWNPVAPTYVPVPAYNVWERRMRAQHPEYLAPDVYMMSYGPDLNVSHPGWSDAEVIDVGRRLTAVSPAIVPFSFSTPFAHGRPADVLSVRTIARTGRRPAVRVFVAPSSVPPSQQSPPLIHAARHPLERGRIEFKAFDALVEHGLYPALLALIAGLSLWRCARPRADVPDAGMHARAGTVGFGDPQLHAGATQALDDARRALRGGPWVELLRPLALLLRTGRTTAHLLLERHRRTGDIPYPSAYGTAWWGRSGPTTEMMAGTRGRTTVAADRW